jgi:hypothetical protein
MELDDTTIRDLIGFTDDVGVLSFYVGHTPAQAADPQPTQPIEIRNELKALRERLDGGDRDVARAVERRLEEIDRDIDELLDPKSSGQGRALFVGVESGRSESVRLQVPFANRVVFDSSAYVRPLVAALDEGRPAGILVVSRHGTRLLEWSLRGIVEIGDDAFEPGDQIFAEEKAGPAMSNPANPQQGFNDKERFEERLNENRLRFFRDVANRTMQRVEQQGWDRLVVSAPPKLRDEFGELLPQSNGSLRVLMSEQAWEDSAPAKIAESAWDLLRSVHRDRERELVESTLERAQGGGTAALGLRHVCDALNEGRVAHLLYDVSLELEGYVSDQGTVHPRVEGMVAQSDVELRRDPLFIERMLEKAITTSAMVTPVSDDTAAPLADHEGVAATLRW